MDAVQRLTPTWWAPVTVCLEPSSLNHRSTQRDKFSVVVAKIIAELTVIAGIDLEQVARTKQNIASIRSLASPLPQSKA